MNDFLPSNLLYPLKFTPIYQARIWGGTQMNDVLNRQVPASDEPIGESWEIVDREDENSVLSNGPMAGRTLHELLQHYGRELVGRKAKSINRFPLLVKLIDAGDRLSLQVHPDEAACARIGAGAEPKTEMWYILAARKGAQILAGLQSRATKQQLVSMLDSPDVENLLQVYPSQPRDSYFITSGTLHAIGGGNLILEIQQNSDTTYRVSDWGRVDANGVSRELHVEKGIQSINFMNRTSPRITGVTDHVSHNRKFDVVSSCPFFRVTDLRLTEQWIDDTGSFGSFHMICPVNAPITVGKANEPDRSVRLAPGETALIPASFGSYVIVPENSDETTVVKTTL